MTPRAQVLLVDDHALFREGLRAVIRPTPDLEISAEASTAREAIELVATQSFQLAVVDVTLPDLSGVSVARELQRSQPQCKVLALSMVEQPYRAAEMLRTGASGYALKSQAAAEILEAIRAVLRGDRYLAPRLPRHVVDRMVARAPRGPVDQLSPREREIFDLLVRGWNHDQIGSQLFISARTVETHRQKIMDKLRAHSIVELVRLAAQHGLLPD